VDLLGKERDRDLHQVAAVHHLTSQLLQIHQNHSSATKKKKTPKRKTKTETEKPPTVISCKVVRHQATLAKLVMARGLHLSKVNKYENFFVTSTTYRLALNIR